MRPGSWEVARLERSLRKGLSELSLDSIALLLLSHDGSQQPFLNKVWVIESDLNNRILFSSNLAFVYRKGSSIPVLHEVEDLLFCRPCL